jgi:hypothetical protein
MSAAMLPTIVSLRIKWGLVSFDTNQLSRAAHGSAATIPLIAVMNCFFLSVGSD